ncbi:MAG: glycosyltransferase [Nocardioidaceae bacterium]
MIGYYVHHQGAGHLRRLGAVQSRLRSPLTVLSSLPRPEDHAGEWLELARDDLDPAPADVDAHATLHWVPRHDRGLAERAASLTAWLARERPSVVVVDVSVEVAVLVRLAGVPVVVVAMPGERSDRAHVLGYDLADALVAPWPAHVRSTWPQRWLDKTWHVGAFSRYDGRPRPPRPAFSARALLLWGDGGAAPTADRFAELRRATPGWSWQLACQGHRLGADQLWSALTTSDVVVTHGGQNAVAEVAAARVPAVVVADSRPFAEQADTVRTLHRIGTAVGLDRWPDASRWPALLERALRLGGDGWRTWAPGDGAHRMAALLDEYDDLYVSGPPSTIGLDA